MGTEFEPEMGARGQTASARRGAAHQLAERRSRSCAEAARLPEQNPKGDGTGIVRGRLLAAVACVAFDHSTVGAVREEPYLQALAAICEAIYRER